MNYPALGEFTAYRQQAFDAADRRFALLTVLSMKLRELAKHPDQSLLGEDLEAQLEHAIEADAEFIAAVDCANYAAPLCGMQPLEASAFTRPSFSEGVRDV